MNTNILYPLIDEAIQNHKLAAPLFPNYFDNNLANVAPVVWFGELNSSLPKIMTFGSNPSDKEFLDNGGQMLQDPRFPNSTAVHSVTVANVEGDDNQYFSRNPYKLWFNPLKKFAEGYFNFNSKNNEEGSESSSFSYVHIDALPFATSEKFTKLDGSVLSTVQNPTFSCFDNVLRWGQGFTRRLFLQIAQNDTISGVLISGRVNVAHFKTIFADYIDRNRYKSGFYTANGYKYLIEKYYLQIGQKSIEVIATSIYLSNPRIKGLNYHNLMAEIKKL